VNLKRDSVVQRLPVSRRNPQRQRKRLARYPRRHQQIEPSKIVGKLRRRDTADIAGYRSGSTDEQDALPEYIVEIDKEPLGVAGVEVLDAQKTRRRCDLDFDHSAPPTL